ncbi:MAG: His/Gly/Thr/Pro-type tRNA ligase C-terminal domain-containing protein, partial [Actinomycetes bacterium]
DAYLQTEFSDKKIFSVNSRFNDQVTYIFGDGVFSEVPVGPFRAYVRSSNAQTYVIEPSAGLTRAVLAFLLDAYDEDEAPNSKGGVDKRTVLRLDPRLAPIKVAVLPLSRDEKLSPVAKEIAQDLRKKYMVEFDDSGAIGRRYRRADEIGTPYAVTVDFETLEDKSVTIRDRDSMEQVRVPIAELPNWLGSRLPA